MTFEALRQGLPEMAEKYRKLAQDYRELQRLETELQKYEGEAISNGREDNI